MTLDWQRTLPVIVSILIIITIGILRQYSRMFAAVVAVMPINIPLGMWIIYAGEEDGPAALKEFSGALFINIIPTLVFLVVVWQTTRVGWGLLPTIAAGYLAWGIGVGLILLLRG